MNDMTDFGRGVVMSVVAVVVAFAAWFCHSQGVAMAAIPIRSAGAIEDLKPGTTVLAYGGVWVGPQDGVVMYINEYEDCDTTYYKDDHGKQKSKTSCDWEETGRTTPPFDVVAIENGQQVRLHVSNGDYKLGGTQRYVSTGYKSRLRGFQNGDGVLVRGEVTPNGLRAVEVWGGTREQYLGSWKFYTWGLGIGAAVLALVAALFFWNS